jgi:hypothetical protein
VEGVARQAWRLRTSGSRWLTLCRTPVFDVADDALADKLAPGVHALRRRSHAYIRVLYRWSHLEGGGARSGCRNRHFLGSGTQQRALRGVLDDTEGCEAISGKKADATVVAEGLP